MNKKYKPIDRFKKGFYIDFEIFKKTNSKLFLNESMALATNFRVKLANDGDAQQRWGLWLIYEHKFERLERYNKIVKSVKLLQFQINKYKSMDNKYNVLERFSGKRISMIPIGTNYLASNINQEEASKKMIERSDEWYRKFLEHYDEKEIQTNYTETKRSIFVKDMSSIEIELQKCIPINLDEIPDMNHFDPKSGLKPEPWEKEQRFFD